MVWFMGRNFLFSRFVYPALCLYLSVCLLLACSPHHRGNLSHPNSTVLFECVLWSDGGWTHRKELCYLPGTPLSAIPETESASIISVFTFIDHCWKGCRCLCEASGRLDAIVPWAVLVLMPESGEVRERLLYVFTSRFLLWIRHTVDSLVRHSFLPKSLPILPVVHWVPTSLSNTTQKTLEISDAVLAKGWSIPPRSHEFFEPSLNASQPSFLVLYSVKESSFLDINLRNYVQRCHLNLPNFVCTAFTFSFISLPFHGLFPLGKNFAVHHHSCVPLAQIQIAPDPSYL